MMTTTQLGEIVVTAAEKSRKINTTQAVNIAQLRVSNMKLHGRDDDIKLLRSKFRELAKKTKKDEKDDGRHHAYESNHHDKQSSTSNNNLILVSGTSGTGKSALIRKGLGDPVAAKNNGYAFASGKFDEKALKRPLSAFSDAMTSLTKYISMVENNDNKGGLSSSSGGLVSSTTATLIREKIQDEFDEEDVVEQLRRVLPGCAKLLGAVSARGRKSPMTASALSISSSSIISKLDSSLQIQCCNQDIKKEWVSARSSFSTRAGECILQSPGRRLLGELS